jgi:DNA-binding MarR family transcriptional regulator
LLPEEGAMSPEMQLIELFNQIAQRLRGMLAGVFRKSGFSLTEIFLLLSINKRKTSRVTELAERIGIPTSTFTGIVDRLEKQGLLERSLDPDDRRSFFISATSGLKNFLGNWMHPMKSRVKEAFSSLPDDRIERLIKDLQYLLEVLDRDTSITR